MAIILDTTTLYHIKASLWAPTMKTNTCFRALGTGTGDWDIRRHVGTKLAHDP